MTKPVLYADLATRQLARALAHSEGRTIEGLTRQALIEYTRSNFESTLRNPEAALSRILRDVEILMRAEVLL